MALRARSRPACGRPARVEGCSPCTPRGSFRRPVVRPRGGGAAGSRGARRMDDRDREGRRTQPPRPVVAAGGRAPGGAAADDPRLRRRRRRRGRQRRTHPRRDQRPGWRGDETEDPRRSLLSERYQGTFADRVAVPRANLVPLPALAVLPGGRSLPTAWLTAYRMLYVQGGLEPGQSVLVQGAGGGVATALITLARAGSLQVFATSRDESKRAGARDGCARDVRDR